MRGLELAVIACALAMDAFAVSLGVGASRFGQTRRGMFRISFHFGLFQFLMPVIGWTLGNNVLHLIAPYDHWCALVLLGIVGIRMVQSSQSNKTSVWETDPTRGVPLVLLSVATSVDALAVGLSLAVLGSNIWFQAIVIGIITGSLSCLGINLGKRLSAKFGKEAEFIGGVLLIAVGIKIVLEHILAMP